MSEDRRTEAMCRYCCDCEASLCLHSPEPCPHCWGEGHRQFSGAFAPAPPEEKER